MNCFVTGARGFIGSHLCSALRAQGHDVTAGLRAQEEGPWDRVAVFDLGRDTAAAGSLRDVSCVFHLAGKAHALGETKQDENEYYRINSEGTLRLLESCKAAGVRRFVFFSSVKAMGEGGAETLDELSVCKPCTAYGRSKFDAEKLVLGGGYVPEPVVLRLSMVYGPAEKGNLPRMIEAVAKGRFPPLPEVNNKRSMVHVDDVVQAALLAMNERDAAGQTYIVTDGQTYSTRQIYEWICEALNRPVPGWTAPIGLLRILARAGDVIGRARGKRFVFDSDAMDKLIGSACYSSEKIAKELGFQPNYRLRDALPELVARLYLT